LYHKTLDTVAKTLHIDTKNYIKAKGLKSGSKLHKEVTDTYGNDLKLIENFKGYDVLEIQGFLRNVFIGINAYAAINYNGNAIILTTKAVHDIPANMKQFLLNHEVGHIENNHSIKILKDLEDVTVKSIDTRNLNYEVEADAYAVNKVGKDIAISTLQWLIKKISSGIIIKFFDDKRAVRYSLGEIETRIKCIEHPENKDEIIEKFKKNNGTMIAFK
jgi:hypothetical protein